MATRNTRSTFTDSLGNARTGTHLSTNIVIKAGNYIVGAVQKMQINERREIRMLDEVGTDGHVDGAPVKSTDITGSCDRIRFDKQRITGAFARGYVHAHAQRIPFDIEIHDFFHDSDTNNSIITTLHQCWIQEISYSYNATDWMITDSMSFVAKGISSIVNSNGRNVITTVHESQDGPIYLNQYEQEADRGVYRGALDAAGVLNAFLTDPTS